MMGVIVTGGAGFIGSCIVRTLNDMGIEDIIVVDHICETDKWINLRNKKYSEYINRDDFLARLPEFKNGISHIIHMGACSATTERNFDFLYRNNYEYSKILWDFCSENGIAFIYASSAATYGDGQLGFDDMMDIKKLRPLNGYGYSKQLFDIWAEKQEKNQCRLSDLNFLMYMVPMSIIKGIWQALYFIRIIKLLRLERFNCLNLTMSNMWMVGNLGILCM